MAHMLTTKQAADAIGLSKSWLDKSRMTGTGPEYHKLGGLVRYAPEAIAAWVFSNRRTAVYDFAERRDAR